MKIQFTKSVVKFTVNKNRIKFAVIHNMEVQDFKNALDCWLARTEEYTSKNLCNYIRSKDPFIIALTERQYNLIISK